VCSVVELHRRDSIALSKTLIAIIEMMAGVQGVTMRSVIVDQLRGCADAVERLPVNNEQEMRG
jgi:hypothetical protein